MVAPQKTPRTFPVPKKTISPAAFRSAVAKRSAAIDELVESRTAALLVSAGHTLPLIPADVVELLTNTEDVPILENVNAENHTQASENGVANVAEADQSVGMRLPCSSADGKEDGADVTKLPAEISKLEEDHQANGEIKEEEAREGRKRRRLTPVEERRAELEALLSTLEEKKHSLVLQLKQVLTQEETKRLPRTAPSTPARTPPGMSSPPLFPPNPPRPPTPAPTSTSFPPLGTSAPPPPLLAPIPTLPPSASPSRDTAPRARVRTPPRGGDEGDGLEEGELEHRRTPSPPNFGRLGSEERADLGRRRPPPALPIDRDLERRRLGPSPHREGMGGPRGDRFYAGIGGPVSPGARFLEGGPLQPGGGRPFGPRLPGGSGHPMPVVMGPGGSAYGPMVSPGGRGHHSHLPPLGGLLSPGGGPRGGGRGFRGGSPWGLSR